MRNCTDMSGKPFRILSIDGGGIRGIIPAVGLTMIEEKLSAEGKYSRICDYFDLICGTSTGAILAIALALGIPAKELLKLYLKNADRIFPSKKSITKFWNAVCNKEVYDRQILSELIEDAYSNATSIDTVKIGHCKTRICIPTYDVEKGAMHIFKTSHHDEFDRDYQIPAYHIALASAAAPIYFDSYSFNYMLDGKDQTNSYRYNVDGGVIANNPTLIGYTEAVMTLKQNPENLRILSLGTGDAIYRDDRKNLKMGGSYWIKNKKSTFAFYSLFSSAQSLYIDNTMKFLQKGAGSGHEPIFMYERIQYPFSLSDNIEMNTSDRTKLKRLVSIGKNLFADKIDSITDKFCFELKDEFIPIHKLRNT